MEQFVRYIASLIKIDKTTYFNTIVQHICQMEISSNHFFELFILVVSEMKIIYYRELR